MSTVPSEQISERPGLLDELLELVVREQASDLHLIAGDPPRMRLFGDLTMINQTHLDGSQLAKALYAVMPARVRKDFEAHDNADFAYVREGLARFRVNVFRHLGGIGAVFRAIPASAYSLDKLGLPGILNGLCMQKQGLILVTGKTGSGKSSTLAAMIDTINRTQKGHIVTIEDPIEFMHLRINCLISQREVGNHAQSFARALYSALREDPDVIMVGELRDLETMSLAVTAAETGILVLGTLHTNNAASTVDRMINVFPVKKQPHLRTMLSTSLRGIVSQQLLKRTDRPGRVAAVEILINTPAVANVIREGKTDQIENIIQGGALMGMQSMDNAIRHLLEEKIIKPEEAYEAAHNKTEFEKFLK